MELKEAFEYAKRWFSKYGTVFVGERYKFYDGSQRDKREFNVSVVFNDHYCVLTGKDCSLSQSALSFEEAILGMEAQLTALGARLEIPEAQ